MAPETPPIASNGRYAKELRATIFTGRAARGGRAARRHAWDLGVWVSRDFCPGRAVEWRRCRRAGGDASQPGQHAASDLPGDPPCGGGGASEVAGLSEGQPADLMVKGFGVR